jgi:hypothetical protein
MRANVAEESSVGKKKVVGTFGGRGVDFCYKVVVGW